MADDSTDFQIDIDVPAGGTSAAADAVARLGVELEAAGQAAVAAANAVRDGEAAYKVAETAANRSALAVEKIGLAADAQRGKLAKALEWGTGSASDAERAQAALDKLLIRQAEAVSKADAAKAAMSAQAAALDQLKTAASAAADREDQLSKAEKSATDAAKASEKAQGAQGAAAEGAGINFRALSGALGKLGGPLGSAGQQAAGFAGGIQKLSKTLGALGPYVAVAVVAVAIAAGFAVATLAVAKFAITSADAARTSALLSAGIAGSVAGGKQLDATIDKLTTTVPQTREELSSMASDLAKTGLRGDALSSALETAAVKAAKLKWGPDFAKQMLSLDSQTSRLKDNIGKLFSGLNIEGFLESLSKVLGLFDSTSATGKAIKVVFESLFQPVIDGLAKLGPQIVATFIQLEIWALKALIAIKPYGSQIEYVAKALAVVAAVVVGVVIAAFALLVAASVGFVTVLALFIDGVETLASNLYSAGTSAYDFGAAIIGGAGAALTWLVGKVSSVVEWLTGVSLADIGRAMIEGLAAGITGSADSVLQAMTGAVGGAVDGAKRMLGIASPSKVFAEIGMNTAAGMAQGVDSGAADVQGSLTNMVTPPAPAASPADGGASKSGGKASGGGHTFIFNGVKDAQDAVDQFIAFFESGADQLGGGEPAS